MINRGLTQRNMITVRKADISTMFEYMMLYRRISSEYACKFFTKYGIHFSLNKWALHF